MKGVLSCLGLAWLMILPAPSEAASQAPDPTPSGDPEVRCPGHPVSGAWFLIAHRMLVAGVPAPFATGGGVGYPRVEIKEAGCVVEATLAGMTVRFDHLGSNPGSVWTWLAGHIAKSRLSVETDSDNLLEHLLELLRSFPEEKAFFASWLEKGSISGYGYPGDYDTFEWDKAVAGEAKAFYAGSLPHEPNIFWILAVKSPRVMRSVHGFTWTAGAVDAPPHFQKHVWFYSPDFFVEEAKKANNEKALMELLHMLAVSANASGIE